MADLKNLLALRRRVHHPASVSDICRHRFFAKDVFACCRGFERERRVLRVRRGYVDGVARFDQCFGVWVDGRACRACQLLCSFSDDVVHGGNAHTLVARKHGSVNSADVTCADYAYIQPVHLSPLRVMQGRARERLPDARRALILRAIVPNTQAGIFPRSSRGHSLSSEALLLSLRAEVCRVPAASL